MRGIIAEVGNHHNGCMEKAKELILAAKESGANYVKMQMIDARTAAKHGKMPEEWYRQVAFKAKQYRELVEFARQRARITLFYSYFGSRFDRFRSLYSYGGYNKISASQAINNEVHFAPYNHGSTIISLPAGVPLAWLKRHGPQIANMNILVASPYNPINFDLDAALAHVEPVFRNKNIGYSDHTKGVKTAIQAVERGSLLVEKHFFLGDQIEYEGVVYRDCEHSAAPEEMAELTRAFRERNL